MKYRMTIEFDTDAEIPDFDITGGEAIDAMIDTLSTPQADEETMRIKMEKVDGS